MPHIGLFLCQHIGVDQFYDIQKNTCLVGHFGGQVVLILTELHSCLLRADTRSKYWICEVVGATSPPSGKMYWGAAVGWWPERIVWASLGRGEVVTSRTTEAELTSVINLTRHAGLSRYWVLPPQLNSKDEDCSSRIQFLLWFQSLPVGGTCRKCEISVVKWILEYSELKGPVVPLSDTGSSSGVLNSQNVPGDVPPGITVVVVGSYVQVLFSFLSFFHLFIYWFIYIYLFVLSHQHGSDYWIFSPPRFAGPFLLHLSRLCVWGLLIHMFSIGFFSTWKAWHLSASWFVGWMLPQTLAKLYPYPGSTPIPANETHFSKEDTANSLPKAFFVFLFSLRCSHSWRISSQWAGDGGKYFSLVLTCMRQCYITLWVPGTPNPATCYLSTVVLRHSHTHFYAWSVAVFALQQNGVHNRDCVIHRV